MTKSLENLVLCLFVEEAAQLMERDGISFEVEFTGPPSFRCEGRERVVRLCFRGHTAILTAAREQPASSKKEL